MADKIAIPERAPFGATVIWGRKGVGKTLACLNSPWQPVHVIDTERSSYEYYEHQKRLVELGTLRGEFTRADCTDYDSFVAAKDALKQMKGIGTLVIDTGGQWSEWVHDVHAKSNPKGGQLVWAKVRKELRQYLIGFSGICKCLLLTAHEAQYKGDIYPRCNPALMEIASLSLQLTRDPRKQIPDATFRATRIPFFPQRITGFTIESLLRYFEKPADWKNLADDEKIPETPPEPEIEDGDYET